MKPTFVFPPTEYPSYMDLVRLVAMAGYEMVAPPQVHLDDPKRVYIFTGPEGIPDCTSAQAHTIFWQMEYEGDYADQPHRLTCDELWGSDPGWCARNGARYVLLGSNPGLSMADEKRISAYDVTMLAYMTPRRQAIRERLGHLRWPENYPGHNSLRRHQVLLSVELMLHVHQHESATPVLAPLRLALAAAYRLPVICEDVVDRGPYDGAITWWAAYADIPRTVEGFLREPVETGAYRGGLTDLLCYEMPFKKCVEEALA